MSGALYLVPNLLGAVAPEAVLPARTLDIARTLRHWCVETPKAARAFLATLALPVPIATLSIVPLPDTGGEAADAAFEALLAPALSGASIGLVSDAGCPGVADPGARMVAAAHRLGVQVVPLVGPSSILLALMASGLDGQRFAFHGYLPQRPEARRDALRALEAESRRHAQTQLFIETPYRNAAMIASLGELAPSTQVCIAADLTLDSESVVTLPAPAWRSRDAAAYQRRPAIFLLRAR